MKRIDPSHCLISPSPLTVRMATATSSDGQSESIFSKFSNALSAAYKKLVGTFESQIRTGKTAMEMPCLPIARLQPPVLSSLSGPYGGLCQLDATLDAPTHPPGTKVAGIVHWQRAQSHTDGDSITLYEHKANASQHHGDPIADVYAVVGRPNNYIIAVADGVNWGIKPRLAARCAIHGCIDHLNSKLFDCPKIPCTTQDIFHIILRSFHSAQRLIIKHGGTTTTLCVAVVVELLEPKGNCRWGLCVVSVGDTLCFVWRNEAQEVHEITSMMHCNKDRNPRDCGGCLGADLGDHPDLSNLCCCFVPIADGDVVFVVSDGVSDNFDPVLLKEAVSAVPLQQPSPTKPVQLPLGFPPMEEALPSVGPNGKTLPQVTPEQRQALLMMKMGSVLKEKWQLKRRLHASDVKDALINHVIEITESKRGYLEQCWNELDGLELTSSQKRANDRKITQQIKQYSGKLDHATVAACKVGKLPEESRSPTNSYHMNTAVQGTIPRGRNNSSAQGGSVFYHSPAPAKKERSHII